jgi:hypothetical protein
MSDAELIVVPPNDAPVLTLKAVQILARIAAKELARRTEHESEAA